MRLHAITLALVSLLTLTSAWTKEDHEIFRLRDELTAAEGPNVTFYSYLGVPPSASIDDISKQYRRKSRMMHPDKALPALLAQHSAPKPGGGAGSSKPSSGKKPGVRVQKGPSQKERAQLTRLANERYARLGVVASILRGPARERYDHFLAQGFPRWRGTGYYYERFRPGLGSVLVSLAIMIGGAVHYTALYVGWKRHRDFVERYIAHARRMAWGNDSGIPGIDSALGGTSGVTVPQDMGADEGQGMALNRRQKRMQEKESKKKESGKVAKTACNSVISKPVEAETIGNGPMGSRKKVVAENGKVLIVDSEGSVYLEETTAEGEKQEMLLDPDEIAMPTIFQTALFRVPVWAYAHTVGRLTKKSDEYAQDSLLDDQELIINDPKDRESEVIESATSVNNNAESRKRKAKGRR